MYVPFPSEILLSPRSLFNFLDDRDKAKFEELHKSIRACDEVLSSVETNLTSFRNDLATVSADIETLQARSTALNVRLENRKAVEKGLGSVVEEVSVSPVLKGGKTVIPDAAIQSVRKNTVALKGE